MSNIKKRGFGSMEKTRQRAIASLGGRSAHDLGRAHKWTSETASKAGKIGGSISHGDLSKLNVSGFQGFLVEQDMNSKLYCIYGLLLLTGRRELLKMYRARTSVTYFFKRVNPNNERPVMHDY